MARKKRSSVAKRERLTFDVSANLHKRLIDFCHENDYYKGSVICDALEFYLDAHGKKVNKSQAAPVRHVATTTPSAPDAYEARRRAAIKQMTGEPLTQQDRDALRGVVSVSPVVAPPAPDDDGLDDLLRRREQESIALTQQHLANGQD